MAQTQKWLKPMNSGSARIERFCKQTLARLPPKPWKGIGRLWQMQKASWFPGELAGEGLRIKNHLGVSPNFGGQGPNTSGDILVDPPKKKRTLPPTNMAPVGRYLEDPCPIEMTPSGAILVGGRVQPRTSPCCLGFFVPWQPRFSSCSKLCEHRGPLFRWWFCRETKKETSHIAAFLISMTHLDCKSASISNVRQHLQARRIFHPS